MLEAEARVLLNSAYVSCIVLQGILSLNNKGHSFAGENCLAV